MEKIIVLGMGGHAESLVDILEKQQKYEIAGFVVNEDADKAINRKYPVIGSDSELEKIYQSGIRNAAIGIGYMGKSNLREILWKKLKQIGFCLPVICDPSAVLASNAQISEGCFVGKGSILNSNASIGKMCIINTGAIIEHDCCVDDFSHISVRSVLCGNVKVGRASFIGANATVIQGKSIGDNSIIGAGTVIRKDVEDNCMAWSEEKVRIFGGDRLKNHE